MLSALTALFTVLTSGAGGGLIGGLLGIFKQSQERRERVEMAKVNLERDRMEYENAQKERAHALLMLEKGSEMELQKIQAEGALDLQKTQTEAEAEIEVSHQAALSSAQEALKTLQTSTKMDDFRASVRPVLAYWGAGMFSIMLVWAFLTFNDTIDKDTGKQILVGMFSTLTFIVTSIVTFYYVARRNPAPKL
jgi:hypothetical protein